MDLWVVIPAYNEERLLGATLARLAEQADRAFTVLVVANVCTDRTAEVAFEYGARVIEEPEKGTGAAADTGMRYAIARGATHLARTDADCLPATDWTAAVRRAFADGLRMAGGPLRPRPDEDPRWWERRVLPPVVEAASFYGRFRRINRDPAFLGPYRNLPGCNLAITAELYELSGGFPRGCIEEVHEDHVLINRVRRVTGAYALRRDMVVYGSVRRLRAYGLVGTLAWYADHRYRPPIVDIR